MARGKTTPTTKQARLRAYRMARYRDELRTLRRYYTGFESRNGYRLDKPTDKAKRSVAALRRKVIALHQAEGIPHVLITRPKRIKVKTKAAQNRKNEAKKTFNAALHYSAVPETSTTKRGKRKQRHTLKAVPIFSYDPKAKVKSIGKNGLKITEKGSVRELYPFNGEALASNPNKVYKQVQKFMDQHHATNIRFNLGSNIIGVVYRRSDFNPKSHLAAFVNMVNRYREDRRTGKYSDFIDAIRGISIVRGGLKKAQMTTGEIDKARAEAKKRRKAISRRARLTGRQ